MSQENVEIAPGLVTNHTCPPVRPTTGAIRHLGGPRRRIRRRVRPPSRIARYCAGDGPGERGDRADPAAGAGTSGTHARPAVVSALPVACRGERSAHRQIAACFAPSPVGLEAGLPARGRGRHRRDLDAVLIGYHSEIEYRPARSWVEAGFSSRAIEALRATASTSHSRPRCSATRFTSSRWNSSILENRSSCSRKHRCGLRQATSNSPKHLHTSQTRRTAW